MVEFIDGSSKTPVHVNPRHVLKLTPYPNDPDKITIVYTDDGKQFLVIGNHKEVANKLTVSPGQ
jgi:hypothetical protein